MSPTVAKVGALDIRERDLDVMDAEQDVVGRWDVRDPSVVGGMRTYVVVLERRTGALTCSCYRLGCRHVDGIRQLLRAHHHDPAPAALP